MLEKCTQLTSVNFFNCKVAGDIKALEKCTQLTSVNLNKCLVTGVFTGAIIRMISDIRAKHGQDSINLRDCGKFTLAEDLSDIEDITSIDLSGINSLEGT